MNRFLNKHSYYTPCARNKHLSKVYTNQWHCIILTIIIAYYKTGVANLTCWSNFNGTQKIIIFLFLSLENIISFGHVKNL